MAHWTANTSGALTSAETSFNTVDNLLSFVKEGQGKPSAKERAIFAAAVVFLYGVWENYVEQLAIEIVKKLSKEARPERIPDIVRSMLEKKTAWELAITPGWQTLWIDSITVAAIGDDGDKYGMNTAKAGQVRNLLARVGASEPFQAIPGDIIPTHLRDEVNTVQDAVNCLVELRGDIVHTGRVPGDLRKGHVNDWKYFVKKLCESVDSSVRTQCKSMTS